MLWPLCLPLFLPRPSYFIHNYSKIFAMTRAPAFKSSANNAKWVKTAPDDEVIEDSEPEREEQRKIEKERRRERR